ncbi:phosphodiester glycosidase family protein [Bacillus sp. V59.32b]|uniref:phosphodiester glycosidase family protein n=1 Tax=Bacillus sp. V59.32b TaxID=1758642 RepID=UPI00135C715B|nr:phosphodiester glycosidase family protein [Bacillus sp. V59.32b]
MKILQKLLAGCLLATVTFSALPAAEPLTLVQAAPVKEQALPLGEPTLGETRNKKEIAPGLAHISIDRGYSSETDVFIIDVAFYKTREEADEVKNELNAQGYESRVKKISERPPGDPEQGPLGYLVRVGSFQSESDANKLRDDLKKMGYEKARVVFSAEDGGKTTGPWVVNILEIDPEKFTGKIIPELGTGIVPGKEKLTALTVRTGALAAINGGYFVVGPSDGTEGDLAGVSMIGGKLISEAVNGRTSLVLTGKRARIASVETQLTVKASDGAKRELDGLNRKPGLIRGCGGIGDTFDFPKHDFTCTDSGELIQFTSVFGSNTEPGDGLEVVLNSAGKVTEVRNSRGGPIPSEGSVLAGTGDVSEWLLAHGKKGTKIKVNTKILADEQPLNGQKTGIVNGGPRLLRDGKEDITAVSEGFHWSDNPEFYYRFGERRNPRTLAGVTEDGKILLVTVDGRQPHYSVGASFKESARIMKALGAVDAVNLDGGGSTAMTIGSDIVNRPSDPAGERAIGDAIIVLP